MPWHVDMTTEREYTNAKHYGHGETPNYSVTSARDPVNEFWSLLKYDANIGGDIDANLKSKGLRINQRRNVLSQIESYIEQAENFYRSAFGVDYRSAALLYYYCFLNLGKAALLVENPKLSGTKFEHGLYRRQKTGDLKDRSIQFKKSTTKKTSVFNELYKLEYGEYLPENRAISLRHLLGYITDVSIEVDRLLGGSNRKTHDCDLHVIWDTNRSKLWAVLVTEAYFYPPKYPGAYSQFVSSFTRYQPSVMARQFVFPYSSEEARLKTFNQSNTEFDIVDDYRLPVSEIKRLIDETLGAHAQQSYRPTSKSFTICDPLRSNWQIPFNEHLSIYATMFCLSEVVRYSPYEFNEQFDQKHLEGWLVKSFIESSPLECMRYLAAKITNRIYLIHPR